MELTNNLFALIVPFVIFLHRQNNSAVTPNKVGGE